MSEPHPSPAQPRRARIAALRTRFWAVAIALFVAVWIALLIQLTTGHDPALAKQSTTGAQTSDAGTSSNAGTSSSAGTTSSGSSNSSSSGVSPVTTRQS